LSILAEPAALLREVPERRRQSDRRAVADRRTTARGMLVSRPSGLMCCSTVWAIWSSLRTRLERRVHELESVLRDLRVARNTMRVSLGELGAGSPR